MDRNSESGTKRSGACGGGIRWSGAAALLALATLMQPCRAESTFQGGPGTGGAVTGSAHLDFRITVLPSLGLSTQATGVRVQGNSGGLTLAHSRADAPDGRAPTGSSQLVPRRQVVDATVRIPNADGATFVTLASP